MGDSENEGMTIMKTRFALCAVLVCMTCTIAVGQQVSVNYNHSASFAQYHTYAWGSQNANQIQNSILAQVAQQDINSAMKGKGFNMVQETQNPDIILIAIGGMRQQTSYSAWGMRGIGGGMGGITPSRTSKARCRRSLRCEDEVADLARYRAEHPQQQRKQEPADGGEG